MQKKYTNLSFWFYLTVLLAGSFYIGACSDNKGAKVSTGSQSATAAPPQIFAFDDDCTETSVLQVKTGYDGRLHLRINNASPSTHAIGFNGNYSNVFVSFDNADIKAPKEGAPSFDIVVRNKVECERAKYSANECNIVGGKASTVVAAFDVTKKITFIVTDQVYQNINTSQIGEGGGMVGDVLQGRTLLGILGKMIMQNGPLGQALGGQNQQQVSQNTSVLQAFKGQCKNGMPSTIPQSVVDQIKTQQGSTAQSNQTGQ